jgi:hypothetical protein
MEYTYSKSNSVIRLPNKELTLLDRLVLDFISRIDVDYVIVSGYVTILFGRDRHTEDVDIFIRHLDREGFSKLYKRIIGSGKYYCINTDNADDAYMILGEKSAIRFAETGTIDPNFEIKFPQNELNLYSLDNPMTVILNNKSRMRIGPLELQLAYKLYLGSAKDYEDAAHIYTIFKNDLDVDELRKFIKRLHIKDSVVKTVFRENI